MRWIPEYPPPQVPSPSEKGDAGLSQGGGQPTEWLGPYYRRKEVLSVLRSGLLKGRPFQKPALKADFLRLQQWWQAARDLHKDPRWDLPPSSEAQTAITWCETMVALLMAEEWDHRHGRSVLNAAADQVFFFPVEDGRRAE